MLAMVLTAALAQSPTEATLSVAIRGTEGTSGHVLVALFAEEEGFPQDPDKAVAKQRVPTTSPVTRVTFVDLPPGDYAIVAFQDLNDDLELNTRVFPPIPKEPFGTSRDAKARFGPQKWKDAVFNLSAGPQTQAFTLKSY